MTTLIRLAERRLRRRSDLRSPEAARGQCVIESAALAAAHVRKDTGATTAMLIRATGHHFPGREHWAVIEWTDAENVEDFTVVDVTARQFQHTVTDPIPVPWTGTLIDWYDAACDWFGDWIAVEVYGRDPHAPLQIADDPIWRDAYTSRDDVAALALLEEA